jgi:hypothetical protein
MIFNFALCYIWNVFVFWGGFNYAVLSFPLWQRLDSLHLTALKVVITCKVRFNFNFDIFQIGNIKKKKNQFNCLYRC